MVLIQKENRANDSILLVCGMVLNNQKCGPGWIWTSSPRFRDHTLASARPSAWNSLPRASAARKNAKSLPATKNAASAKHVGLEFVELEVRYEWMIYISKHRPWPIPWMRTLRKFPTTNPCWDTWPYQYFKHLQTVSLTNMCPLRPTYPSNLPKELQNSYLYDTNKTKVCMAIDPSNIMQLLLFPQGHGWYEISREWMTWENDYCT